MKKSFICLVCVLAMVMQLFMCGIVASADAVKESEAKTFFQWDGTLISYVKGNSVDRSANTLYSKTADSEKGWTALGGANILNAQRDGDYTFTLANDGDGTGYIASRENDPVRGDYYEYSYSLFRGNIYNNIKTCPVCTGGTTHPVMSVSFYINIPKETAANTRIVQLQLRNTSDHTNSSNHTTTSTLNLKYDGSTGKLSFARASGKAYFEKVWGTPDYTVVPDKWYKAELRLIIDADGKLGIGVYYDDKQVAYYRQTDATGFKDHLTIYRIDITGSDTKTSPGLTYLDDFTVALADAKHTPSETEPTQVPDAIELSADASGGNVTATATMTGDKITNGTLIVALYDGNNKLIKLTPSSTYTDSPDKRIITCSLSGAVSGNKYKVFLFDSLQSAKPLAEMIDGEIYETTPSGD